MPEERRNPGGDRRRQPRRKTERKVTTGSKLDLILDVTRRLMSITDLDALLRDMATVTTQLLDADRATIFIVDRERGEIWSKVALGTGAGEIRQAIGVGIAGLVAATGDTVNITDAYDDPRFNPEPDHRTGYRTKSLLTFPMTGQNDRVIGVFQVVNKNGGGEFTADDEETLSSLGASAAVAVENAQLVAEQRRLWTTLIETLAVTIDARDQQTAGHSQRVTRYAEVIGRALGLEGIELEKLRAAALLHDYGKIAVRDEFLLKPGKLDDAEFEYMKAHAEKTGEFLAHLVFPQDMREVPVIAAQHHERMDGKGYPRGLPAERILLGARIVAAADVFDALTAPRYYKPAYTLEKTLEIMDGMAGDHLDPKVVAAVRRNVHDLEWTLDSMKHTWPKPGDEGMSKSPDTGLSERDQAASS
ncbi:MAG TPA: HD domain-containing phosphohydrolase [Candidatus Udaeobacter sp.]|jgi:HD-GYP domain-containing protein (c-di-GMP phosphodiesterase class II)|nr:HD domain-containing phosphohydrolase [Candidatus Udaeobacter sp.]